MIDFKIRLYEGPKGLHVEVVANGSADSKRAAIYIRRLQEAIKLGLIEAGAEVNAQGLGGPLGPEYLEALKHGTPPVQTTPAAAPAVPKCFSPRPPLFSEFMRELLAEFDEALAHERAKPKPGDEMLVSLAACRELVKEKCDDFMTRVLQLAQATKHNQQGNMSGKN